MDHATFEVAERALRALLAAEVDPAVLISLTPATLPFLLRSVSWLWREGVRRVDARLCAGRDQTPLDSPLLQQELTAVARQQLFGRLSGEPVSLALRR